MPASPWHINASTSGITCHVGHRPPDEHLARRQGVSNLYIVEVAGGDEQPDGRIAEGGQNLPEDGSGVAEGHPKGQVDKRLGFPAADKREKFVIEGGR